MNHDVSLDDLDRALSRAAERAHRSSVLPPRRTLSWSSRLRRAWDRHRPWIKAVLYGAVAVFLATSGEYLKFALFVLLFLPRRIDDFQQQRKLVAQLASEEEFLKAERERLEKRLGREVFGVFLMLAFASLMAFAAVAGKHPLAAGAVGATVAALALLRWALFLPGLRRELADLGGDPSTNKLLNGLLALFAFVYILCLPLILGFHFLRDLGRRLRGLPPVPADDADSTEEDDDEHARRGEKR
jgi:hypothetical protein